MRRLLFWLGFIWALPVTLVGLALALVTCSRIDSVRDGAWVLAARPWWTRHFFERFHVAAYCWGATIHMPGHDWRYDPTAVVRHELVHFKQARIFGVFLPIVYGVCALTAWAQGGHPYRDNWLERWAREESGR